ncbi:bacitracin ABC transporter ATP-binding protein [Paraliobacillus quinghaiensis]|uniref:Bacitracin ABC transporter ATP-binding protein n=1 Tax=Paraliobacillus quinghaiensis TaxID=470815 RepID=A0A917TNJ8_9BACI|nr:ABC transporter ATP-binding protein [Paraliobacillus quinghaiensis]GGM30461.1 bacitracin ABC transporter ATP-binding protein [Paraliobacillus quinghaiensis]
MEREPIIQLKDLKKKIGRKTIIHGISLDLYPGEVFGFLGPNGAGKTTTIRMMVGLMKISAGEVLINGHSVQDNFEKAISYVGGIIENPEMYKYLSGRDNLIHYARMIPNIKKEKIDEIVKLVGLEKRIHEKVKTYSLGMRQRLGLAQALLHSPSILILDEPTNGLDPAGIREIRTYIRRIAREENITVFVSSHLLSEMQLMCDRIGIIHHGKLISVEDVTTMKEDNLDISVHFDVTPSQKALDIVKEVQPDTQPSIKENWLTVQLKKDEIANLNKVLVDQGIDVSGIYAEQKTLEEKFLEVTGGDSHV